jgi:hypothetical protein
MAQITVTRVRVAKNGMTSYKNSTKREAGTIYFDKKMFPGGAPETLVINADGIQEPILDKPKPAPAPAAETVSTEAIAGVEVGGI